MAVIVIVAVFLYGLLQGTFTFVFCRVVLLKVSSSCVRLLLGLANHYRES